MSANSKGTTSTASTGVPTPTTHPLPFPHTLQCHTTRCFYYTHRLHHTSYILLSHILLFQVVKHIRRFHAKKPKFGIKEITKIKPSASVKYTRLCVQLLPKEFSALMVVMKVAMQWAYSSPLHSMHHHRPILSL